MGLSSKLFRVFVVSVLLVSVFGCGKSDDKQQQDVKNLSPTVSIALDSSSAVGSDILEVVEGNPNLIVIHATANDPEGQSLSYEWNVTSDLSLDLGNVNTNKLEFVAPDVKEDSVFDVTVTVSDVKGASAQASSSFTIKK
ncbi:PKD domain-containing protein [Psychrosphaera algicola]|uniref:PKD domain-containing protein n=1 Tax=Psychrosphaera algicola TaxID=3023714 RepID=A0ABT5FCW2_9GAMM|nr:hypothetical protein [Psychrosphaera sp. G1-22]MDC2888688.1 hypothetical protein [Psychrosphaera sp. G1-22]